MPSQLRTFPAYAASEGLPEADVDLDRRVGVALAHRRCQIDPQGSEGRVVAQTETDTVEKCAAELRHGALVIAAGIDKRDDTDVFGHLNPCFEIEHQARSAADRLVA